MPRRTKPSDSGRRRLRRLPEFELTAEHRKDLCALAGIDDSQFFQDIEQIIRVGLVKAAEKSPPNREIKEELEGLRAAARQLRAAIEALDRHTLDQAESKRRLDNRAALQTCDVYEQAALDGLDNLPAGGGRPRDDIGTLLARRVAQAMSDHGNSQRKAIVRTLELVLRLTLGDDPECRYPQRARDRIKDIGI